ncbi:GTPase-associated protein 1-related protein [Streptomyces sp. NPDC001443]
MTLRQLHYTSAPPGPDGSGFRFTAVSPGTDAALLRLAEPLLGYEPPRGAPDRPTEAELPAFPTAFGFSLLPDGTGVLSRTRYTGTDYSGRYGNFHAHALLVRPGDNLPGRMLPIEAWESPDWRTVTPADRTPPPLETLRPGGRFGRERLTAFARRRAGRLAPFLADVRRLFAEEQAPSPSLVMIEEGAEEVALWVALACAALPYREAAALTFTTYTRRPYLADQRVVGVPVDAEFGYASTDLSHQFRVHHCLGGTSSVPRPDPWAAVAARVWLAGRPGLLARAADEAPFDAQTLAARALHEGIALDASGRATGARWALEHAHRHDPAFWQRFVTALLDDGDTVTSALGDPVGAVEGLPGEGGGTEARTPDRPSGAVAQGPDRPEPVTTGFPSAPDGTVEELLPTLLDTLAAHWPQEVTEPLARAVVHEVADGRGTVPDGLAAALSPGARAELARTLGPRLATRLADPAAAPGHLLDLLRLSSLLGTDLGGHPPPPAPGARLADHLLAHAAGGAFGAHATGARAARTGHAGAQTSGPRAAGAQSFGTPAGEGDSGTPYESTTTPRTTDERTASPGPTPEEVAAVLAGRGVDAVLAALLDRLNDVALAGDPGPVVPVLARLSGALDTADPTAYPHLRVVAAAGRWYGGTETGLQLMNRLTRDAGQPETADPSALLTAFRLAWPAGPPSTCDALMLLRTVPSALLEASGLDAPLARAALVADPTDPEAPELARGLLQAQLQGSGPADPRLSDALNLLIHAEDIRAGEVEPGFTAYAVALRDRARPLADGLERRLARNLAARLLVGRSSPDPGRASVAGTLMADELEQLARSGDEALLATYEAEAKGPLAADRLRRHPLHLAVCFVAWNSFEGLYPAWDRVRLRLLEEFLRPTVRKLPDTVLADAETHLTEAGASWADRWRRWYRPGLGRRWARRRADRAAGAVRPSRTGLEIDPGTAHSRGEAEEV